MLQGATKVLGRWARNYVEDAFEPGTIRVTLEWSEYAAVIGGMRRTRSDDGSTSYWCGGSTGWAETSGTL